MGRRSLRRIHPDLDLSAHLLTIPETLPQEGFSPSVLFSRRGPLEIEVGSGKGLFLLRAATARADHNFLGIELAERYARFAAARLARSGAANARVVHGDAVRIFQAVLPPACAVAVHIYFPDPWWKKKHHKRRVMRESFLRDVARVLEPGGELHFWTDVAEYFQESVQLLRALDLLEWQLPVAAVAAQHDLDYHTHFERRTRLKALPVFRAHFRKPDGSSR